MKDLPVLDERRCTNCGDCVAVCPTSCLEMVDDLPTMPRPGDCIECGICVVVCPVGALSYGDCSEKGFGAAGRKE